MSKLTAQPKYLVEAKGPEIDATAHEMMDSRRQKYLMVNVIARRARELNRGDRSMVDVAGPHTPTDLALAEIDAGKLRLIRRAKSKVLVSLIKNE